VKKAKKLPIRKHIRLPPEVYQGPAAFSVTISTAGHREILRSPRSVSLCVTALMETATDHAMEVLAYCFMPDHLHLLLQAKEGANLIRFMKAFKQVAAYRHLRTLQRPLWQKGYYDHVLRWEEDVRVVAQYIFQNPLRPGLVSSPNEYPFVGGSLLAGDLKVAPTPSSRHRKVAADRGQRPA
jgi:putative transposase